MTPPFKREFTLREHSSMIHFQKQQAGACLRATEFKPKLDRFLIEHHFQNNKSKFLHYLVGFKKGGDNSKLHNALDYKVLIRNENENLQIAFFSFKGKDLLDIIGNNLEAFLVLHSFGKKQNKGNGNYTLLETEEGNFEKILLDNLFTHTFYKNSSSPDYELEFQVRKNQKKLRRFPPLIILKRFGKYSYLLPNIHEDLLKSKYELRFGGECFQSDQHSRDFLSEQFLKYLDNALVKKGTGWKKVKRNG